MSRKFNVGDRVRINCPTSLNGFHGRVTTITGINRGIHLTRKTGTTPADLAYVVDLIGRDGRWVGYEPHELIPIYDGHELSSWSEIEKLTKWKPAGVSA